MAIKINLKKNDETKNGFVGFSFTTFFWKAFVPIFRGDNKGFLKFFLIWLVTSGLLIFLENFPYDSIDFDKIPSIRDFVISLFEIKYKYIFLLFYCFYSLLALISFVIWIFIAKNYNKNYTNKLLNQGYMPSEDDSYSLALLKEYGHLEYTKDLLKQGYLPPKDDDYSNAILKGIGYLEYTDEDLLDKEKMERYKVIIEEYENERKKDMHTIIIVFALIGVLIAFFYFMASY